MRLFKILIFRLMFSLYLFCNDFFQYYPNFGRYIRSKLRFTEEEAEV